MKLFPSSIARLLQRYTVSARTARLAGLGVVLLCLTLIAINVRHAINARADALANAELMMLNRAQAIGQQATTILSMAETVANQVVLELEASDNKLTQDQLVDDIVAAAGDELPLLGNVVAVDTDGKIDFILHDAPAARAWAANAVRPSLGHDAFPQTTVSHPVVMPEVAAPVVLISRSYYRHDGSFGGIVTSFIGVAPFEDANRAVTNAAGSPARLLYQDGTTLAETPAADAATFAAQTFQLMLASTRDRKSGSFVAETGGVPRLYVYYRTQRFNLTAVVAAPLENVLFAWTAANRVSAISAAVIALVLALLGVVLHYQTLGRRAAEEGLQQNELQFRMMINDLEDYGIYMFGVDGRIMTWNIGAERVTGFSAQEAIGADGSFCFTDSDRTTTLAAQQLDTARSAGRDEREGWRIRKDGKQLWVHIITTPLYDRRQHHYGYLRVLRDMTTSKRTAEALEASEFRWKFAVEGASEGVWDINELTGEISGSRIFYTMLGYEEGEVVLSEAGWEHAVHRDDLPAARHALAAHRAGITPSFSCQFRMRCKDRSWKWILTRGMIVNRDANGVALRFIGTHADISQLKRIEQRFNEEHAKVIEKNLQLEQASKVKSEFLANMSHELRTPLNAVLGFTGTMLMELPGPLNVEQRKQLEIVRDGGRHLLALINDILDLAKVESGAVAVVLSRVCCQSLAGDIVKSLAPLAAQKNLLLKVDVPDQPLAIQTDARLLKQILINLVGNAIKFTDSGVVSIQFRHIESASGGVWIDVCDTGIGIRSEDLNKLFLPFSQIDTERTRRFEGTGIGLSVCRKYAEMINATLDIQSTPGLGSIFSVKLPGKLENQPATAIS